MTSSNPPPRSESELVARLAALRTAPPDEERFLESFRARLVAEAEPVEIPGVRVLPFRRKVPKVVVVAAALALAGAAAAATLRLVREERETPNRASETPSGEKVQKPPSRQRDAMVPEEPRITTEPEKPARIVPRHREDFRSSPPPAIAPEPVTQPRAPERAPVSLERLELRRQSDPAAPSTGSRAHPLERSAGDRPGAPSSLERATPDRSLQKVGPGGMSREERMGQQAPVDRRPGGAPPP